MTMPFERAVAASARIVKGRVTGKSPIKIDGGGGGGGGGGGKAIASLEVRIDGVIKGAPARPGETLRVLDPGVWYRHTHAAAIKGGVVSYAEVRYATPLPRAELEAGAPALFFLNGDPPPAGLPANAVFLVCDGGYDRPAREPEVAKIKSAGFGDAFAVKVGETTYLPEGLAIAYLAHSHKRPQVDGPRRETAELTVVRGGRSQRLDLPHVIEGDKHTWGKTTVDGYQIELVDLSADGQLATLRVRPSPSP
jgi:hypothetical protein